jgi:type VI secretion system secreted protein VgrG
MTPFVDMTGQTLGTGGTTPSLTPGVYRFPSSADLTGALTLNNGGVNNSVFVFQIGSTLTTAASSSVLLTGAGTGVGVFWDVGTSATLGAGTAFEGNILALVAITLGTGATIECGSALARDSFVHGNTNTIDVGCGGGFRSVGDTFELIGPGGNGDGGHVPEPSTLLLLGSGLVGLAGVAWRRHRK